jgi:hypothetical protein
MNGSEFRENLCRERSFERRIGPGAQIAHSVGVNTNWRNAAAILLAAALSGVGASRDIPIQELSKEGPALFAQWCAGCHGPNGRGGRMPDVLGVRVPDLTALTRVNHGVFPFSRVEKSLTQLSTPHVQTGLGMPVWGLVFSDYGHDKDLGKERARELTRYIESLQVLGPALTGPESFPASK